MEKDMNLPTSGSYRPSRLTVAVVAAWLAGTVGVASMPAVSASPGPPNKVTICHATGSATNPYVQITVSENAVREGRAHNRDSHQGGEDIIPPEQPGQSYDRDGRNWVAGETSYNDGCLTFAPDILPPSL
jgi:hypothetical protein